MDHLPIDTAGLLQDLETLATYTEPGTEGWTRRAFSPAFVAGRAWLAEQMREAALEAAVDAAELFERNDTAWGPVLQVRFAGAIEGFEPRWAFQAGPTGQHEARWQ